MPENLRSRAYEDIKERILFADYKPGEKIFETDIIKDLDISRTPVREALLILEKENLVECDERLGYIVRRINPNEISEYFNIRSLLELYAVPLIIEMITEDDIDALERNLVETELFIGKSDFRRIIRCNLEFHKVLWQSTKSDVFFQTIDILSNMFLWFRSIGFVDHKSVTNALKEHKEILSAIKEKDAKTLKRITRRHLKSGQKGIKPYMNL